MGAHQRCYYARYWQALSRTDGTTDLTLTKLEYWTQTGSKTRQVARE